jgi:hypothetical protein
MGCIKEETPVMICSRVLSLQRRMDTKLSIRGILPEIYIQEMVILELCCIPLHVKADDKSLVSLGEDYLRQCTFLFQPPQSESLHKNFRLAKVSIF